jgi:hypothetical protein
MREIIISPGLDRFLQGLIRQRLNLNLTTQMMIKAIFLTNYRVQAFSLYTPDSVLVRLVAEHVHVDIKVHS